MVDLIEHLRSDHEPLEPVSYAVSVMIEQQRKDEVAKDFHRMFEDIEKGIKEEP